MFLIKAIVLYLIFGLTTTYAWKFYEFKAFGEVKSDPFDTAIAIVLALSLTVNVILYRVLTKGDF